MSETESAEDHIYPCVCKFCEKIENMRLAIPGDQSHSCVKADRRDEHCRDIATLIMSCPKRVTLLVGPDKVRIKCHKALLGFKSEYFDAICFGGFSTAESKEIEVQEEDPKAIQAFVAWLYSAQILPTACPLSDLWLLGDRIRSPEFMNEVMHTIFERIEKERIEASEYKQMFIATSPDSKLRQLFRNTILQEGPLGVDNDYSDDFMEAWKDLMKQGGELVVDIALRGSLFTIGTCTEHRWKSHNKYLEPIEAFTTRPIEDFIAGKPRAGTR
ncbi:hypothetical protein LSUE1_G009942 [Lachnellula suecica]|uniref:BTB domain-containing protein n=1 Tax=Lachnellula suecica TaxID=602035 RepID=A0A8T9BTE2_9HELO|nr:hypothetical protein LSUE1_G009942 [Lachnellula suecica]